MPQKTPQLLAPQVAPTKLLTTTASSTTLRSSLRQTVRRPTVQEASPTDMTENPSIRPSSSQAFPVTPVVPKPTALAHSSGDTVEATLTTVPPSHTFSGGKTPSSWDQLFEAYSNLPHDAQRHYTALFEDQQMPAPKAELLQFAIDNEFLLSMGITMAGHRAMILAACKVALADAKQNMARPRLAVDVDLEGDAANHEEIDDDRDELMRESMRNAKRQLPQLYRFSTPTQSEDEDEEGSARSSRASRCSTQEPDEKLSLLDSGREMMTDHPRHLNDTKVRGPTDIPHAKVSISGIEFLKDDHVTKNVFHSKPNDGKRCFTWIDVAGRDRDRSGYQKILNSIADEYGFAESLLLDMDLTLALPQVITSPEEPDQFLIILRVATEVTDIEEDSLHLLTNRWMIVVNTSLLTIATIHRADSMSLAKLRSEWDSVFSTFSFSVFVCKIFDDSLLAYIDALHESEFLLDQYESVMLHHSVGSSKKDTAKDTAAFGVEAGAAVVAALDDEGKLSRQRMNQLLYHLHRRCSVYSRMLSLMQSALETAYTSLNLCSPEYAEQMSRSCGELAVKAESLHDNCQNLLNLHLSLVSFRTNELMGILTTFSAFFIPLTFIGGVYGMNFDNMPELHWPNGYFYCLGLMGFIEIAIFIFFRVKGLL